MLLLRDRGDLRTQPVTAIWGTWCANATVQIFKMIELLFSFREVQIKSKLSSHEETRGTVNTHHQVNEARLTRRHCDSNSVTLWKGQSRKGPVVVEGSGGGG